MQQVWKVRQAELKSLQREAAAEAASFAEVNYRHYRRAHPQITQVDRSLNAILDKVSNR
jgi:hypothetical protein